MKKIVVILDYAHGSDVKGKRSPDGRHLEWKWSRMVGKDIKFLLETLGYTVYESNTKDTEIGLTSRRKFAEDLNVGKGQIKVFISLHNNAAGDGSKWMSARGFEIWTKKGQDLADDISDITFPIMNKWFPEMRMRKYQNKDGFMDKEGELAVLKANDVYSLLVEYLFQDNKEDVELLLSDVHNKRFTDAIVDVIEKYEQILALKSK